LNRAETALLQVKPCSNRLFDRIRISEIPVGVNWGYKAPLLATPSVESVDLNLSCLMVQALEIGVLLAGMKY